MRIGSLFSGIGGLELGLEWAGVGRTVWQVEIDPFCRGILARHWPDAERFTDVTTLDADRLADADVICGGFPCQDVSSAGRAAGIDGARSGLWYHFARIIDAKRPRIVVVENVASGKGRWLRTVREDLHVLGYGSTAIALSAADVGAPHLRRRIFVVAHADGRELRVEQQRRPTRRARRVRDEGQAVTGCDGEDVADANGERQPGEQGSRHEGGRRLIDGGEARGAPLADAGGERREARADDAEHVAAALGGSWDERRPWRFEPDVGRVAYGVPLRLDRLAALGNGVVPQCAEVIGRMIVEGAFDERR